MILYALYICSSFFSYIHLYTYIFIYMMYNKIYFGIFENTTYIVTVVMFFMAACSISRRSIFSLIIFYHIKSYTLLKSLTSFTISSARRNKPCTSEQFFLRCATVSVSFNKSSKLESLYKRCTKLLCTCSFA